MAIDPQRKRQFTFSGLYIFLALLALLFVQNLIGRQDERPRPVPYSELLSLIRAGRVARAEIRETEILAELRPARVVATPTARPLRAAGARDGGPARSPAPAARAAPAPPAVSKAPAVGKSVAGAQAPAPATIIATRIPATLEDRLVELLVQHGVAFAGRIEQTTWWQSVLGWLLPLAFLVGLYSVAMRRLAKGGGGPLSFGKSRVKIYDRTQNERVTFEDVAGVDEAEDELREVVDFLKHPDKYQALGARIPKGVLLVGPPGTGKTLLAKAVAGEAGVPFFSISASEFVEMFVGVGAARMRDLFEQAKQRSPCIVFIDELDAIGKSRGGLGAMGTHDEREQTLNQLLVEMDGFDPGRGVVIMAATNRPEVLDQALVRAGRFDRQVLVDRPDLRGRREILRVHARGVDLAPVVDLEVIARRTPGMVGADLANIVNEAALAAARRGGGTVETQDFEEAIDRVQLGLKRRGRVMNEEEQRRVAFHEAGHALVALSVQHADPVHRVSIIPRSIGALGITLQLPTDERYLMTREELCDRICVMLGGRVAEELVCGGLSTGAQNDLERVTELARQMVCRFGMSEALGPQTFGQSLSARFLQTAVPLGEERNYSEQTAQRIDAELQAMLGAEQARARQILTERRAVLEAIGARLLAEETLDQDDLAAVVAGVAP